MLLLFWSRLLAVFLAKRAEEEEKHDEVGGGVQAWLETSKYLTYMSRLEKKEGLDALQTF